MSCCAQSSLIVSQSFCGIIPWIDSIVGPDAADTLQEFVLAMLCKLGAGEMTDVVILSGGTDGEDGPTDAAGAVGDGETLKRAEALGLSPQSYLDRHDAYAFFEAAGGMVKTGLTQTNVMDVRVVRVG